MINTILKCVSVGTGVATVALALLDKISTKDGLVLLGLGLTCMAVLSLDKHE